MSAILDRADTDGYLARRARSGDISAFDELYRRYRPRLAAYAARILSDREAGEDVAQIALFNAYRALQRGTLPTNPQAWLFRIAQNAAYEVARRRRDVPIGEDPDGPSHDVQESSAIRGALIDGLRELPERQRATFALRELHGCSTAEVAERLELTVSQVEQALFAARNRLAEQLVLGERASCDSFRDLDPRSLDHAQRRILRAHARSCASCRRTLNGRRALGAAALPIGLVASAREAAAALLGNLGAPAAAKVGAAVVTAAVATSVPVTVDAVRGPAPPAPATVAAQTGAADVAAAPEPVPAEAPSAAVTDDPEPAAEPDATGQVQPGEPPPAAAPVPDQAPEPGAPGSAPADAGAVPAAASAAADPTVAAASAVEAGEPASGDGAVAEQPVPAGEDGAPAQDAPAATPVDPGAEPTPSL